MEVIGVELTLVDQAGETVVDAELHGDRVLVTNADVARATGWVRKPEGMCRDEVCVPLRDASRHTDDRVDLTAFAEALQRPLAVDGDEHVAFLGSAAQDRAEQLTSQRAPDFALPDLDGRMHTLSAQRGKKVLLVAYASW
jgi:hypothetical protein